MQNSLIFVGTFSLLQYLLYIRQHYSTFRLQKLGEGNEKLIDRKEEMKQNKENKKRPRYKNRQIKRTGRNKIDRNKRRK